MFKHSLAQNFLLIETASLVSDVAHGSLVLILRLSGEFQCVL